MKFPGDSDLFRASFLSATMLEWRGTMHESWLDKRGWSAVFKDFSFWALTPDDGINPAHGTYGIAISPAYVVRWNSLAVRAWRVRETVQPPSGERTLQNGHVLRCL